MRLPRLFSRVAPPPVITTADAEALEIRALVQHGAAFALDVDMKLPASGVTALFGASGCGKTTLLRAVAGLTRPRPGRINVAGQVWQDDAAGVWLSTHRRPLGMVFQEASLFAHLDVQGNLDYGRRRIAPEEQRIALEHAIELLGIAHLLARRPAQLSGGERQRVAIARALAASPRLLLMDEPLAALDEARKAELLPYFERLQRELALPILYVSHSLDEVARLAQHIVLMEAGKVLAHGAAGEVLTRLDLPLARSEAAGSVVEGVVERLDTGDGLLDVRLAGGALLHCLPRRTGAPPVVGQRLRLRISARDVSISLAPLAGSSILNSVSARVLELAELDAAQALVVLDAGAGARLLVRLTRRSVAALQLAVGQQVCAHIKAVAVLG